jgi:hypothetical protein
MRSLLIGSSVLPTLEETRVTMRNALPIVQIHARQNPTYCIDSVWVDPMNAHELQARMERITT